MSAAYRPMRSPPWTIRSPRRHGERKKDAGSLLNQLSFVLNQKYVRPSYVAGIYARMGEKDQAFHWLERAYQERDANLLFLKTDESWDSLRADPRFLSLEQRVLPAL